MRFVMKLELDFLTMSSIFDWFSINYGECKSKILISF
jgi:hypothetical protein